MPASKALHELDLIARRTEEGGDLACDPMTRTQAALVRALLDEVRRCSPSDTAVGSLLAQLAEETERLGRLARDVTPTRSPRYH